MKRFNCKGAQKAQKVDAELAVLEVEMQKHLKALGIGD
jgi:hypothetical protein